MAALCCRPSRRSLPPVKGESSRFAAAVAPGIEAPAGSQLDNVEIVVSVDTIDVAVVLTVILLMSVTNGKVLVSILVMKSVRVNVALEN